VTSAKRSSVLPDVPTFAEVGFPGVELTPWWGVFAAARTPQPIVDKLAFAFNRILEMPDTKAFLAKIANDPMPGTPASLRDLLAKEVVAWGERIKLAGIEPQ
jgi:tripartite-type tricarboxylate transporter receptor subunit TctC